jgi:hypothetical protein
MGSTTITTPNVRPVSYTGFKFNGNCILDSIVIQNYVKTDTQVLNTSVSTLPEWTPDVQFLASMNNTVDGSNVTGLLDSPTKWSLYRHEINGDVQYKVCDCDPSITSWIDYKAEGNKKYEYILFAESTTQISDAIVTDSVELNSYGNFLIDAVDVDNGTNNDSVETYKFDANLKSDKFTNNNSVVFQKNFTQFDTATFLNRNLVSGSFTAQLLPIVNGEYDFMNDSRTWNDYLKQFRAFINSHTAKYLKLRSGEIYKVITSNSSSASMEWQYQDEVSVQPNSVSIYVQEIAKVEE